MLQVCLKLPFKIHEQSATLVVAICAPFRFRLQDSTFLIIQEAIPSCAAPHLMPHPPTPVSHRARKPIPCAAAAKVKVKTTYVHHAETQSDFCDLMWSLRHSDSRLGGSCKNVAAPRVPCVCRLPRSCPGVAERNGNYDEDEEDHS